MVDQAASGWVLLTRCRLHMLESMISYDCTVKRKQALLKSNLARDNSATITASTVPAGKTAGVLPTRC